MAKILLVEDDKSLREIYGVRLMAEGYTITSAGDGEEALAVAIKERPDLIVSDVMMPKISGFDMLDILRSTTETKNIKVIMMTALSSEDQRARGEALGADRYLVKSQVGIEDVVRTVHDVLGDGIGGAAPAAGPVFPAAAPVAAPADPAAVPALVDPLAPAPVAPVQPTPVIAAPVEVEAVTAPVPVAVDTPAFTPIPQAPIEVVAPAPYEAPMAPAVAPLAPVAPAPIAPEPFAVPAFQPAPAPVAPVAPAPAPFTPTPLPQPTAPFSSNPPAGLGDRIINPLPSADSLTQGGVADIASQMNQELNAHIQALNPDPAPVTPAPLPPQQYAIPPQPPVPPLPPQPGV
ncbi:MAG: sensor hybrid histidine kinase [Candidatus Saccharibacteria bacterium]|nr:sensor hybrid histidine kinase [Candidatus Saccharibacteria bacterium]